MQFIARKRRTGATMIARCTPSERIRSASVLMCFMPTFTSSGKNTKICTEAARASPYGTRRWVGHRSEALDAAAASSVLCGRPD